MIATVVGKVERRADGTLALDAVASGIRAGSALHRVDVPVLIQVAVSDVDARSLLDVGAQIEAQGTARPGRPGDRAVLEIRASRGLTVLRGPPGVLSGTAALRQGLVAAVRGLPGAGAGLVPGLAVGDTSAVSAQLDAEMKQSSLSHLTAVSGANCAIVVGLVFAGAAAAGARRGVRVACALLALGGFVLLVTPEPSVVRAAVMAAIAMLGVLLGRAGAGMALLSLATALALAADPWLASSLGFALSVTATASLLLFARPLAAGLGRRLPRSLALALSVPLAAQLACGPLLVLITPAVPVFGVAANLLAAPAAPLATVIGLAACLAAPIPVLRDGLVAIAWLPASWIAATAATITALPGDLVPWVEGWPGAVLLALVGGAIAVLITVRRGPATIRRRRPRLGRDPRGRRRGDRRRGSGAHHRGRTLDAPVGVERAGLRRRAGRCRARPLRGRGHARRHGARTRAARGLPRSHRHPSHRPAGAHPFRSRSRRGSGCRERACRNGAARSVLRSCDSRCSRISRPAARDWSTPRPG